jgi:hypothetical protein
LWRSWIWWLAWIQWLDFSKVKRKMSPWLSERWAIFRLLLHILTMHLGRGVLLLPDFIWAIWGGVRGSFA